MIALIFLRLVSTAACADGKVPLYFFWGEGCPHCAAAKPFLERLRDRYPRLEVRSYEVFSSEENLRMLKEMAQRHGTEARGVPMMFVGGRSFSGFSEETAKAVEAEVEGSMGRPGQSGNLPVAQDRVSLPFLGSVEAGRLSLPALTVVIALLDSFNPCAFFVLFFLLSLLIHAHSRQRMFLVGGIFVFFSAAVYFFYMAAWLNFFILFGGTRVVTLVAGAVALVIAVINIKDFFFFERGVSLVIPEQAKPRLFERMRNLIHAGSLPGMLAATVILAVAANSYEVLCTAGFPMVYTRALTLHQLPLAAYYLYLLFYNIIYVIPLG
jgi:thiol-disulfide isomerase/thioredoxin